VLELWFDFSCPYAYLGSTQAHRLGVEISWRPMLLGGVFRGSGAGDGPMATLSPAKARHNLEDMMRWADVLGVPFRTPAAPPMRTVRALRGRLALPHARWPVAIAALYAAYWAHARDITQDAVIAAALRDAGLPAVEVAAALARVEDPALRDELRARTDEALALGVFGAPAWIVRRPQGPLLMWGQDRMAWVGACPADGTPTTPPRPRRPRRCRRPAPGPPSTCTSTSRARSRTSR